MKLGFVLEASNIPWRHPDLPRYPGTNFERIKEQALIAERAKADLVFFADTFSADVNSHPPGSSEGDLR